jgi:drug/metabolite transporter (DMT)-like permease
MSLLGCVTAPLGAALSALFLGTEISALDIAAIALVIGAVALPTFLKFRSPAAVEPKR